MKLESLFITIVVGKIISCSCMVFTDSYSIAKLHNSNPDSTKQMPCISFIVPEQPDNKLTLMRAARAIAMQ